MKRFDIESYLDSVETFLKANLNAKLSAIDSEKSDGITLKQVSSGAYFLQSLNDKIMAMPVAILYGVESSRAVSGGPITGKAYTINVIAIVSDEGADPHVTKKMFRYNRALVELFEGAWAENQSAGKLKVESLEPVQFKLPDSAFDHRAAGVSFEVEIV